MHSVSVSASADSAPLSFECYTEISEVQQNLTSVAIRQIIVIADYTVLKLLFLRF